MPKIMNLIDQLRNRCLINISKIRQEEQLSPAEFNGISALSVEDRVSGSDLSRKLNLSPSRASRVIDKLVKNGYLIRENDELDRRRCTIRLAQRGIMIKNRIDQMMGECEKRVVSSLSDEEISLFTRSIKKINEVL